MPAIVSQHELSMFVFSIVWLLVVVRRDKQKNRLSAGFDQHKTKTSPAFSLIYCSYFYH